MCANLHNTRRSAATFEIAAAATGGATLAIPGASADDNLYPGIQILTVKEILDGKRPQHPAARTMSFPDPKMAKAGLEAAAQQRFKVA